MGESRFWTRVFAAAGAAVLLYLLAKILVPFLGPILWATLLAFILFPVNRALRRRLPNRRGLVSALLTFAVTLGIVIPSALLMLVFFRQASELLSQVSQLASRYQIERPQDLLHIPALGRIVEWVDRKTPLSAGELQRFLVDGARHALELLLPAGRQVILGAVGAVVGLLLMLFILYFLFRDGDKMAQRLIAMVPLEASRKKSLFERLAGVMRAVVFGSLATALIQGALVGLAFSLTGLPSPVVFGFLTALAALLPVGGTALVWVPAAITLYAQGHPGRA
ncbi:MAG TPA: AI-2E family transporter, partial [Thermoanaerobaculia bacterium]|nr:AI-2E family transporter [Thermoanaerobaculia bacterium]